MTDLLTSAEAAQRLRVTYGTLAQWRHHQRRKLPFVRIGRKIFYRSGDLEAFIIANVHSGDGSKLAEQKGAPCPRR